MPPTDTRWSGWRGIGLVAITYVYFLIFAQFAFLKRLTSLGIADAHLKAVMAAMAVGGIALSLLAPRFPLWPASPSPRLRFRVAFAICATAALCTLLPLGFSTSIVISFLIGSGLGLLTVTLVTHLRMWLSRQHPLLEVGLGTGIGYLICNFPPLFTATPRVQAITAAILCLIGIGITFKRVAPLPAEVEIPPKSKISFLRVLTCLTALVWLDSAAFFIIQSTPALKAGTWEGTVHLCANGLLHLVAALACVFCLRRFGLSTVLSLAFFALASACLLLLNPHRALLASVLYPVGVSLYSVALVAYPSLLSPASSTGERGRMAGAIYAIAGWLGSAMGIGMGQNLGHVPPAFVLLAGTIIFLPSFLEILRRRKREVAVTVAALLAALCGERFIKVVHPVPLSRTQIERGRRVYISEGCINCHSQYVRPNTSDVLMWGPTQTVEKLRLESPPLIGNRRQGPDLAEVAIRRSPLWLKAHFYSPSMLSPGSFMPSYAYLFGDSRGNDLLAYVESLGSNTVEHLRAENAWRPAGESLGHSNVGDGATLFRSICATCHDSHGLTRTTWHASFTRLPPDLTFLSRSNHNLSAERRDRIAQVIKFGIPGTDMPGHEYLSDSDIASISFWLTRKTASPIETNKPIPALEKNNEGRRPVAPLVTVAVSCAQRSRPTPDLQRRP
jgi:cytochrome c oxidase cbb3-type subunit 2